MRKRNNQSSRRTTPQRATLPQTGAGRSRFAWAAAGVLALAVVVVYGRAIDSPLIFDDYNSIQTNETIVSLWPLVGDANQPGPLRTPQFAPTSGRPLVNLSFALNYWLGGVEPRGYHLVNVILHWESALLLWAIVQRTLRLPYFAGRFAVAADWLALAAALLWAVHPLQTEAVIYATQRTEVMMAFFYLATVYCSLRYWTAASTTLESSSTVGRAVWLVLAMLSCVAGMASKEVMVSAPLVALLFERTFLAGSFAKAFRQSWPLYACLACGWLLLLWLNLGTPHSDAAGFHAGVPAHVWWLTQCQQLLMYLKLVVWPRPLAIHYETPYLNSLAAAWMYVVPVAALGLGTLVLLWRNHSVGFLATAVFAILSPTLVVPIITEVAAERRMYLALAPIVVLVVVGGYCLASRAFRENPARQLTSVTATAAVLAAVLGAVSVHRLSVYANEMTLWQDVVRLQPHNHVARQNIGVQLFRAGHVPEAIEYYREAIRLKPEASEAHYNLGLALQQTGKASEAADEFALAVRYRPGSPQLTNNWGVALFIAGRNDEAIAAFQQTIELQPDMWRAYDNLGRALARAGKLPEAVGRYERAVEINPYAWDVHAHLFAAQARAGMSSQAIATAEKAAKLARSAAELEAAAKFDAQVVALRASENKTAQDSAPLANPPPRQGGS